jgi:hypothetical protein
VGVGAPELPGVDAFACAVFKEGFVMKHTVEFDLPKDQEAYDMFRNMEDTIDELKRYYFAGHLIVDIVDAIEKMGKADEIKARLGDFIANAYNDADLEKARDKAISPEWQP